MSAHNLKDLTGQKFGRLTVISRAENGKSRHVRWNCICDCGAEKIVQSTSLLSGHTISCGCYRKQRAYENHITHGLAGSRLDRIYTSMKTRCYNEGAINYADYGGRGITMDFRWYYWPEIFFKWAQENGYAENLTIDRKNNDGNYEPSNCRWATPKQQANNKRNNVTYQGKTMAQWAEETGINYKALQRRIYRGWSWSKAIHTPVRG